MIFDYRKARLDPQDRALCDYAIKLTLAPGRVGQDDVRVLQDQGLSDEQITIAAQVISYFNYINRIADGLGVDDEPWMTLGHDEWLRRKGGDYAVATDSSGRRVAGAPAETTQ